MEKREIIVIMVKPSSALCNMRCEYCFYKDEAENRVKGVRPFMAFDVVDNLIKKAADTSKHIHFAFQGGEPSLIGLDFFRRFLEQEKLYPNTTFSHAFQTNGFVIDDEWATFFHDNNFLVGVSFDGGRKIHDVYRPSRTGEKTSSRILEAINVLRKHEVEFNILIVVTKLLADNIDYAWSFLKGKNLGYLQFIPCMDTLDGTVSDHSLDDSTYGNFLCRLFDLWYDELQRGNYISVRLFDNFVQMLKGYPPESCELSGTCSIQYVVESDGLVYPCDFFSLDECLLGSILEDSFGSLDKKRDDMSFIASSPVSNKECESCDCFILCRGGCKRYRKDGKYIYCMAMKRFFDYAIGRLVYIAKNLK